MWHLLSTCSLSSLQALLPLGLLPSTRASGDVFQKPGYYRAVELGSSMTGHPRTEPAGLLLATSSVFSTDKGQCHCVGQLCADGISSTEMSSLWQRVVTEGVKEGMNE